MLFEHTDLLSYDDIDRDVDGIFRAFCDTTLIEYAKDDVKTPGTYWAKVVKFRRENLSPYDRPDFLKKAGSPAAGKKLSDVDFEHARGFLYWFDVRADYWSRKGANQKLVDTLVPAEKLGELYRHAETVKERIDSAGKLPGASDDWTTLPRTTSIIEKVTEGAAQRKAGSEPPASDSARKVSSKHPPR